MSASVILPIKPKRVRYKVPTYKKSDKIRANILAFKANQKHIFRYKTMQKIYGLLAKEFYRYQLKLNLGDMRLLKDGVVIHFDFECTKDEDNILLEIDGTQNMPIGERLKIHIRLLRLLRQGVKLKKAVKLAKKGVK
nr:MAG TPA: hypothetical protein [Caudoviricetes sp.]